MHGHAKRMGAVALIDSASWKTSICLQTLKFGANDRSAQELQNELMDEVHTIFLNEVWPYKYPAILYNK
jgi:hypothetical protein